MTSTEPDVCCADILKVLANDTRLRVVQLLLGGPRNVTELNDDLQVEKTLLSHHLKTLRDAGIVETTRVGKTIRYCLAPHLASTASRAGIDLGCCQLVFEK